MSPIFLIVNLIAVLYAFVLLKILSNRYRLYFLVGCLLPLPVFMLVSYIIHGVGWLSASQVTLFFLRGGLIASILSGTLVNFLMSYLKRNTSLKKTNNE